ncbi:MAG: ribonuclease Z [Chitinophagales bacterium]|nr:ribonuclease Z [Chitinophagales bacterium]
MQFEVTILGSNSAIPAFNRYPSAQILNYHGNHFLIDCGEGTQFRMNTFGVKRGRLDNIFISHLHGDHYFGLIGLLTSFNLNWREHLLNIYGPPELEDIINVHFRHSQTKLRYAIHFHPLHADEPRIVYDDGMLSVETIILEHRLPTTGFLFREKKNLRKIIPEKITEHNIPYEAINGIKRGGDFTTAAGTIIPNSELTLSPPKPSSYAYCSDTIYTESYLEQIKGVDLLYHEATFIEEHAFRAAETFHCTTKEAARIAQKAGAAKLLIGHFSARYEDLDFLLNESREVFSETYIAEEGKTFSVDHHAGVVSKHPVQH